MSVRPEELAQTMLARHRRKREAIERRAGDLKARVLVEVRAVLAEGVARRAWLIGSLAWGGFDVRSDVDLVFEALPPADVEPLWARLSERLGAELDVLRLEDLPDGFRERVIALGVVIDVA